MSDDLTLAGQLTEVHKDGIVLAAASAIEDPDPDLASAIDGLVLIGFYSIQWVQVLI